MAMSLHESKYSHREETEESPLNILKSAILSLSKIDNCDLSEPITILQVSFFLFFLYFLIYFFYIFNFFHYLIIFTSFIGFRGDS